METGHVFITRNSNMDTGSSRIRVITLAGPGVHLSQMLAGRLNADLLVVQPPQTPGLAEAVKESFNAYGALVMVMACGIAARMTGPLLRSKHTDPAIVVADRAGRFAVSLAGGHEGGANQLACDVASLSGGEPVITTGTEADRLAAVGVGYQSRATARDIEHAVRSGLELYGLTPDGVKFLSTGLMKWEDREIRKVSLNLGLLLRFFPRDQLSLLDGVSAPSQAAMRHFSIKGVSEQCALLSLKNPEIILPRTVFGPVTISVAREKFSWSASVPEEKKI
jgi:cobalt-precorrin 5A hydrolase